jgi:hypothetical protein
MSEEKKGKDRKKYKESGKKKKGRQTETASILPSSYL